jgi:HEPN domain-containing protein
LPDTDWKRTVERELGLARAAADEGNHGKARTCARRAIGVALTELQRSQPGLIAGSDFIRQLRGVMEDERFEREVRDAARRLQERIAEDFSSPSKDPVGDAMIVLRDVIARMERG